MAGIDTANLILWKRDWSGGGDFLKEIPPHIDVIRDGETKKTSETFVEGKLSNLYVKVTANRVVIGNSLCTYFLGNNINGMTRRDTEQAVEMLSDALHVPMGLANVSRIDYGANIIMEHETNMYYPYLGYMKGFNRMEQTAGLLYQNKGKTREVELYDKIAKAKIDKVEIPELYRGKNLLRLEYRVCGLTRKDRRELGVERIRGETLYTEKFHIWANDNWRKAYGAIEKKTNIRQIDFNNMETVRELQKMAIAAQVTQNGGLAAFVEMQETRMRQGKITPKQKMDLIKAVKDAMEYAGDISNIDGAVEELERKVKAEIKFYR